MQMTIQLELPLYAPIQLVIKGVKTTKRVVRNIPNIPEMLQLLLPLEIKAKTPSIWKNIKTIAKKAWSKIKEILK
jgi:hypothetical protein